jgi:hypothetical protein
LFYDSKLYLAVQLEELGKTAINFSRYSWNPELEFKAGIYGIRVGTIPNCSVLKLRGTNSDSVEYPISGKDSRFLRNMVSNLEEFCTIQTSLQQLYFNFETPGTNKRET